MYYETIHEMVRKAAAANEISIEALINSQGISRASYYRHLRYGTPWKTKDIKALADITGKHPAEILEQIL